MSGVGPRAGEAVEDGSLRIGPKTRRYATCSFYLQNIFSIPTDSTLRATILSGLEGRISLLTRPHNPVPLRPRTLSYRSQTDFRALTTPSPLGFKSFSSPKADSFRADYTTLPHPLYSGHPVYH